MVCGVRVAFTVSVFCIPSALSKVPMSRLLDVCSSVPLQCRGTGWVLLPLQTAADELNKEGLRASVEQLDITSAESCAAFAATLAEKYKGIDCLVNNAGPSSPHFLLSVGSE